MGYRALDDSDVERFLADGYVTVRGCFSRELARSWTEQACRRLHCSLDDPTTWPVGSMRSPDTLNVPMEEIAPRAWQVACELAGGEERIKRPCPWSDSFLINFGREPDARWQPPSQATPGWHKDGDFFRHFLDSPEQGLLVLALFSDLEPKGGGTFVACDSVGVVARHLAQHPEGLSPGQISSGELIKQCREFVEVTGRVGDVLLLHPFMLHAASVNVRPTPRFLINPPVHLDRPLCFSREDSDAHSPVERAILRALDADRLEFVPTRGRETFVPARVDRDHKLWEERARAALTGGQE